ncbi:MAG TPA: hypothetical protein EYG21_03125 [Nitrospinaceae bacterium]|jgi:hypothetical protein|nr:hypothetical protein [Nitrospinaceae bacterium]
MARRKTKNLTPKMLRRMIVQERRKLRETSDPIAAGVEDLEKVSAEEVDADEQADTLEKDIDHLKVLKIQEAKLRRKLREVSVRRRNTQKRIKRKL